MRRANGIKQNINEVKENAYQNQKQTKQLPALRHAASGHMDGISG
jgi:hypothetical protein